MAEFAFNVSDSASTKLSLFFVNYGFEPRMSFESLNISGTAQKRILSQKAASIKNNMENVWTFAAVNLHEVRRNQETYANRHKKSASTYESENKTWLSTKNITTNRPSKKLNDKQIELFEVIEQKGNIVKLKLQNFMKIHDNFHVFLLKKNSNDSLTNQIESSLPPVMINNEEEWKVDDVLDSRQYGRNKKLQYRVKWVGYPSDKKWYDAVDLKNALDIVVEYHKRYFQKSSWFQKIRKPSAFKKGRNDVKIQTSH